MAETVEKFFDEKLAMMPPEEYEIVGKGAKTVVKPATSSTGDPEGEPPAKKGKKSTPPTKPRTIAAGRLPFHDLLNQKKTKNFQGFAN